MNGTQFGLQHGETVQGKQILKPGKGKRHHEKWLKLRSQGIGASDVSAILGLNSRKTPLKLWLERTGQIPPQEETFDMKLGRDLEPLVAQYFADETGLELYPLGLWQSKARKDHTATPDRGVVGHDALLECKVTGVNLEDEWEDGQTSDHAEIQAQAQAYVLGVNLVYVAALVFGRKKRLEIREIRRDDKVIAHILRAVEEFMLCVHSRTPPAAIEFDDDATLDLAYPLLVGERRELNAEAKQAWFAWQTYEETRKTAERGEEKAKRAFREFMAGAEIPTIGGHPLGYYKEISVDGHWRKPSTYRRFFQAKDKR